MTKKIVSFSGGKNSMAMLLLLREKGYPIDGIVFADTGAELPETYEFIAKVEESFKQKISIVKHRLDWFDWFYGTWTRGSLEGQRRGFPILNPKVGSWCIRSLKINPVLKYANGAWLYVGISASEIRRVRRNSKNLYPLVDWRLTDMDCYNICVQHDLLNPIYGKMTRSGCWPCPNKNKHELENLYRFYPELWHRLLQLERDSPTRFNLNFMLSELDEEFELKSRQMVMEL